MKRVNDNGRIEQILDVMKRDNLIKSKVRIKNPLIILKLKEQCKPTTAKLQKHQYAEKKARQDFGKY